MLHLAETKHNPQGAFFYPIFLTCCFAVIESINFLGKSLAPKLASLIVVVGTIINFLLNIHLSPYLAQDLAVIPGNVNFTCATLLKLVSTGPGQRAHT